MQELIQLTKEAGPADTTISVIRGVYGTVPRIIRAGTVFTTLATPVYQNEDLSTGLPPTTTFWPVSQWWIGLLIGVVVGYLIRLVS